MIPARCWPLALLLLAAGGQEPPPRQTLREARTAFRSGDFETAARHYRALARAFPDRWGPHEGVIRSLQAAGRHADADDACAAFLRRHPDHAGARALRAGGALRAGRPARALELLGDDLADVRHRSLAARALEALGRYGDAASAARPLADVTAPERDEYMKAQLLALARGLAVHARYSGDADAWKLVVQAILPEILRADPADADARALLGECFLEKYNRPAAAEAFGQALRANPRCVPALLGQARLAGPTPAAHAMARAALTVDPSSEEAHAFLVEFHLSADRLKDAREAADRGLEHRPRSVPLLSLRAAVRFLQKDEAYAEDVGAAEKIAPGTPLPSWRLARAMLTGGRRRFGEAQEHYRRAVDRAPTVPPLLIEYGTNCLRVGDEATGLKILREAVERDPFHVRARNLVNLFEDFASKFDVLEPEHFRVRIARSERRWMEPPVRALLERGWTEMTRRYGFAPPEPVLVELFTRHSDFSVRTVGVPDLGALGACFGRVVTSLSPRARDAGGLPPYRWSAVLWHELAHVFSLELSKYRVPRWLTEGLATHEERLGFPGTGRRDAEQRILQARHAGLLGGVAGLESDEPLRDPVLQLYLQGAEICAFIQARHGFDAIVRLLRAYGEGDGTAAAIRRVFGKDVEAFDRDFFGWLDARLSAYRVRLPSKEPRADLVAGASKDPSAAAKLAFVLLEEGKPQDAETYARKALEAGADAHSALGRALLELRRPEEAVPHLRKGTDDLQNWTALGRALASLERWEESAAAFARAAGCFPAWVADSPWRGVNEARIRLRDYDGAVDAFSKLIAADPLDFRNRLKLAKLHQERGATELMAKTLQEAARIRVMDLELLDLQAAAERARRRYAEATERTEAALALLEEEVKGDVTPQKADRLCDIGEDWLARGRKDRAREFATSALRLVSGHPRARKLLEAAGE